MTRVFRERFLFCGLQSLCTEMQCAITAVNTESGARFLVQVPARPPTNCLTLGRSLNFICKMGDGDGNNIIYIQEAGWLRWLEHSTHKHPGHQLDSHRGQ